MELDVERLFPFHLIFDHELTVSGAGPALLQVGGMRLLGRRLHDILRVRRGGPIHTYAGVVGGESRLLIAELESHGFFLGGPVAEVEPGRRAVFLCSPWTTDLTLSVHEGAPATERRVEPGVRPALHGLREGTFAFRSLTDARALAFALAGLCPRVELVALGLIELMVNAIEHGNLELGYEEKRELCRSGAWRAEMERRLTLEPYRGRVATVHVQRQERRLVMRIRDEGPGFRWSRFMSLEPERARDPNGRGIALARSMGFERLHYEEPGNVAVAEVALEVDPLLDEAARKPS